MKNNPDSQLNRGRVINRTNQKSAGLDSKKEIESDKQPEEKDQRVTSIKKVQEADRQVRE